MVDKIPVEKKLSDDIPFHKARELSVSITIGENGKVDVYVDGIITMAVDINDNLQRIKKAPVTVMHAVADNATLENKNIKRKDIVSDDKNEAERAAEEEKICLGWLLNTRRLLVNYLVRDAQAIRSGAFSKQNNGSLVEQTVSTTLAHMAQTFRTNNQCDPRLDQDSKTCFKFVRITQRIHKS